MGKLPRFCATCIVRHGKEHVSYALVDSEKCESPYHQAKKVTVKVKEPELKKIKCSVCDKTHLAAVAEWLKSADVRLIHGTGRDNAVKWSLEVVISSESVKAFEELTGHSLPALTANDGAIIGDQGGRIVVEFFQLLPPDVKEVVVDSSTVELEPSSNRSNSSRLGDKSQNRI